MNENYSGNFEPKHNTDRDLQGPQVRQLNETTSSGNFRELLVSPSVSLLQQEIFIHTFKVSENNYRLPSYASSPNLPRFTNLSNSFERDYAHFGIGTTTTQRPCRPRILDYRWNSTTNHRRLDGKLEFRNTPSDVIWKDYDCGTDKPIFLLRKLAPLLQAD